MKAKKAIITGTTGQDGSYLAEFLLSKGYEVHGTKRRSSLPNTQRLVNMENDPHLDRQDIHLHYCDVTDSMSVYKLIQEVQPDEIYNLAAQSHVRVSFETPEYTANVDALGTLRILEAVRSLGLGEKTRIYQASTSELYGKVREIPQSETTPFHPRSPYAVAKMYSYWMTVNYREAHGLFASNGILFNHESERRDLTFVTRKISSSVALIKHGKQDCLYLGNLEAKRDWGYAPEYVEAMWMILQHDEPDDFVVATGETHSVREFVEAAFATAGIQIEWKGEGVDEKGYDTATGKVIVAIDPWYYRPSEVDLLIGDPTKTKNVLGWEAKTKFQDLVKRMVEHDLNVTKKGEGLPLNGLY